jgi:hypothetical protein
MFDTLNQKTIWKILLVVMIAVGVGLLVTNNHYETKQLKETNAWPEYQRVTIRTDTNETIQVVIADTPEKRFQGLSNTQSLAPGLGMLFIFDQSANNGFWMKDMQYPIDIFWFDDNYQIIHTERNVSPDTFPQSFGGEGISRYVLETNPGELKAITKISIQK